MVPLMPVGPVFALDRRTAFAGGAAGRVAVVVVVGGLVVVVVGLDSCRSSGSARWGRPVAESDGGGEVSTGSHATPRTTSAKAQVSTPVRGASSPVPIRPVGGR